MARPRFKVVPDLRDPHDPERRLDEILREPPDDDLLDEADELLDEADAEETAAT